MFNCPLVDEEGKKHTQSCKITKFKDSEAEGDFILPLRGGSVTLSPNTRDRRRATLLAV